LEHKVIDGKDFYLVKWKGYTETSWEPDENIGEELDELKESARRGAGTDRAKRKHKKDKKEKKEKKRRRRGDSSDEKRRKRDSDSESSGDDGGGGKGKGCMPMMPGMPPGMMPGMPPPGMPLPPEMMMMPPGMMPPPEFMGKGMEMGMPPPMMMKGKGKGKDKKGMPMPPPGMPMPPGPFPPWDPLGKGFKGPPMMKGKFMPPGFPGMVDIHHKEALDTQRFAIERKRRVREFVSGIHARLSQDKSKAAPEKLEGTKAFQETIGLQLEDNQLPVIAPSEVVVSDALWLLYLFDATQTDEDKDLIMKVARLSRTNASKARRLLIRSLQRLWAKLPNMPSGIGMQIFSDIASGLPQDGAADGAFSRLSAEDWRERITRLYEEHNPAKLGDVPNLLQKYRGREKTLYLGICEKYKVKPEGVESKAAKFKELICEVYREHNPSKLDDVDKLLAKYKGREENVYKSVCEKYKVTPKLPKQDDDKKSSAEKYKQLISDIYAEHNKEKLGELDEILKKYVGKEKSLYLAVCTKYNIEPKLPGQKQKKKEKKVNNEEKAQQVKEYLLEIYKEHNPSKLDDLDKLLSKYEGREELLYHSVCEKYKVEPKIPKPAQPGKTEANGDGADGTDAATGSRHSGPAAEVRQAYSDLIKEVYREHNPGKLSEVDRLLDKYLGQEQDLYITICNKYSVTPKEPEGLGDTSWIEGSEERLEKILSRMLDVIVLHGSGLGLQEASRVSKWEEARPRIPLTTRTHEFDLQGLNDVQIVQLMSELRGDDGARWQRLEERCGKVEISAPKLAGVPTLGMSIDGAGLNTKVEFDNALEHLGTSLNHAARVCLDEENDVTTRDRWNLPWTTKVVSYIRTSAPGSTDESEMSKIEVGVEYKRGCWTCRRKSHLYSYALHHNLFGPAVQSRLPDMWREVADNVWSSISGLQWGAAIPLDVIVTVEVSGGRDVQEPNAAMPKGCTAAAPSAAVIITAAKEEDLEQAKQQISPLLTKVLSELSFDALFVPTNVFAPQQRSVRTMARNRGRSPSRSESSDEEVLEEDDYNSEEEVLSDAEPTENYRPIRLSREKLREAFMQGVLCLNCDSVDHRPQDCPFKKKVCWNCHGNHAGNECPFKCRFSKERRDSTLMECMKRICRRVADWRESKAAQEQRAILNNLEVLQIKLDGFEDPTLAKHHPEVQALVKTLAEQNILWPGELTDLAVSILNMQPPKKKADKPTVQVVPPPPAGAPPKPKKVPKLPKDAPPPMPETKYPWQEKIFLDHLLAKGLYGANILSRIIGRAGANHRRMESESGARVFFRGVGVSAKESDLAEPVDCRLHIAVKGDVPLQAQAVRRIIKDLINEIDNEIAEKGEIGPLMDRPRDPDAHPFGFLLPKNMGPEGDNTLLKFKFPEEDGQALTDMLVWLKHSKLPLELDTDTQWRTTLQVTPAEPALPDDAPNGAQLVFEAFDRMLRDWAYPCPYWFEEHDLSPTGLWTSLTSHDRDASPVVLQQGQGVRLSPASIDLFATLLDRADLISGIPKETAVETLKRLRGVVRRKAQDEALLLYLAYPWAYHHDVGKSMKLPFSQEQVHNMLVQIGRVGGRPTESNPAPPFRGFVVEWLPLKGGDQLPEGIVKTTASLVPPVPAGLAPGEGLPGLPGLPTLPPPAGYQNFQALPPPQQLGQPLPGMPLPGQPVLPSVSGKPKGYCKYWLPEKIFFTKQNIHDLIAGPGGAHFGHLLKKYPSVDLRIDGQPSTAAPPAHRLHVIMSTEDTTLFDSAATDVLDLVETVCDMVGEELGLGDQEAEGLIRDIRAEKYIEANGVRTPLPATRKQPAAEVPAPQPSAQDDQGAGEFEFIDEDIDMEPNFGPVDDDARTEASDAMSDLTEADEVPGLQMNQSAFDEL